MPVNAALLGQSTRPMTGEVDARWLMAYAAGIDDCNPAYMDTCAGKVIGHPLFPVCLEWPVILSSRELPGYESMTPEERSRGVHAAHDLHIYKPIKPDQRYTTRATVVGLAAIKPGAAQTLRIDTRDASGELVCRTWQLTISRGVGIEGEPGMIETPPAVPDLSAADAVHRAFEIPVRAGAGNVYTETARIFNPIHSDKAFAVSAGLPDVILHGTATLALAVSRMVDERLGGDPRGIHRIGGRFSGMVLMPSVLTLVINREATDRLGFEIKNADGQTVFSQGYLCFGKQTHIA